MPTGYTADIAKGMTFQEYALSCARAFGACMHQRDAAASELPTFSTVAPYYEKSLQEDQAKLTELLEMNIPAQTEYGIKRISERKFANPTMAILLEDTGYKYIEETNTWGDTFWGVCNGVGKNVLGNLLMEIREHARLAQR